MYLGTVRRIWTVQFVSGERGCNCAWPRLPSLLENETRLAGLENEIEFQPYSLRVIWRGLIPFSTPVAFRGMLHVLDESRVSLDSLFRL